MVVPSPRQPAPPPGYAVPRLSGPIELKLDANEGRPPPADWLGPVLEAAAGEVHRYPKPATLEARLASRLGVDPARVLVTAGGDEGIERAVRTYAPGATLVSPSPTFEMFSVYAGLYGARVRSVPWGPPRGPESFPVQDFVAALNDAAPPVGLAAVVTPNSPTGLSASKDDLSAVLSAAQALSPAPLVLLDHAYVEFSETDLTAFALTHPHCLVVRTFSKAYGLAGLRVGYLAGHPEVIRVLRNQGTPYPFSRLSLAVALRLVEDHPPFVDARIEAVKRERARIAELFRERGHEATSSEANFVWVRVRGEGAAEKLWRGLGDRGIAVRFFDRAIPEYLRITCPADPGDEQQLLEALTELVEDRT